MMMVAPTKAVDVVMERMDSFEMPFRGRFCHGLDVEE